MPPPSAFLCGRQKVVLFGNPKGGTLPMQDQQPAGIDLPLKALVWQDAEGKVWLSYNAPE